MKNYTSAVLGIWDGLGLVVIGWVHYTYLKNLETAPSNLKLIQKLFINMQLLYSYKLNYVNCTSQLMQHWWPIDAYLYQFY